MKKHEKPQEGAAIAEVFVSEEDTLMLKKNIFPDNQLCIPVIFKDNPDDSWSLVIEVQEIKSQSPFCFIASVWFLFYEKAPLEFLYVDSKFKLGVGIKTEGKIVKKEIDR